MKQIRGIWKDGLGVVTLHVFQNTVPEEAFTREACMILALGKNRLFRTVSRIGCSQEPGKDQNIDASRENKVAALSSAQVNTGGKANFP